MEAAAEVEVAGDEQQSLDEIWGERAQQLVEYVKANKPPVAKKSSIHVFAMRKGWEPPTLAGILKYCIDQKLLVAYQAVSGAAFKIPMTPVFDVANDDAPADSLAAGAVREPDCLCSRTAPAANYGCPTHGGARLKKTIVKETTNMATKEWITTPEAAKLLGCTAQRVSQLVKQDAFTSRKRDASRGAPREYERVSVLAFIEKKKHADMLDEKPAKAKAPPPQRKQLAAKTARSPKERTNIVAKLADEIGALREDVIMLVRLVDRGWMSKDEAFAKLRGIADAL